MNELPATISAPHRGWPIRLMSVVAVAFGLLTLKEGGAVLLGSEAARAAAGNIVPFVLWFNFVAGFAYVAAGVGLWLGKRWATRLAMLIALANVAVLAALGVHIALGLGWEKRTLVAMLLRTVIWLVIAALAWRHEKRGQKAAL